LVLETFFEKVYITTLLFRNEEYINIFNKHMGKKRLIILGLFVLLFSGINLYLYFNQGNNSYSKISGLFMEDLQEGMNLSVIIFIGQWVLLLAIVLFAYTRFLRHKREQEEVKPIECNIQPSGTGSETELDCLYKLLQEKKRLSIDTIAKSFNVSKEKALEWAKILENSELVTIEYPAFNDPEVKIIKKEEESKE
jgi:hypothetical protein